MKATTRGNRSSAASPARRAARNTSGAGPLGAGRSAVATLMRLQSSAGNRAVADALQAGGPDTIVQRLVEPGSTAPPERPSGLAPNQDPRFASMATRTRLGAHQIKAHPPAASEVRAAQAAAQPPANAVASQADAAAVGDMSQAKPGPFDKAAFMAAVRTAIAKAAPKDLKEADEFASSGQSDLVKAQVKGQVSAGKDSSAADIKTRSEAPPDPSRAVIKPVTPMVPTRPPANPGDPGAAAAMPSAAPAQQTNLSGAPNEVNGQMAEANVTDEQLAKSNEPEFVGALAAKQQGEAHSATAPAEVRAQEGQILAGTQSGASSAAQGALATMRALKGGANAKVTDDKTNTKTADQQAEQEMATAVEKIYTTTKTETETILTDLDGKVDSTFETGEKTAKDAFEQYHSSRVSAWKYKRYIEPTFGWTDWIADQFKPLNPELIKIFQDARAVYVQRMDAVISGVADLIGTELGRARQRIAKGRDDITAFVGQQQGAKAKYAQQAQANIGDKFAALDTSVDDKQSGLVDDLANRYVEARKGVDDRINALQDENKGLWEQAKGLVTGVIDTIVKLKAMLMGVLARAAGAVEKIIKDPMAFLGNLVSGVRAGLDRFVGNINTHLRKGLTQWLLGELSGAGIEIPETFDLKGIFNLVASILGLTWTNFRTRLVGQVGEKVAGRIEQGLDFVKAIAGGGLSAAWQWIVTKVTNLKDMVMDQIKTFVIERVVMAGIQWIVGLLNPAAAFVKACKMIYDVIMWFVDNGARLKALVDSVLDSVESIVAGNLGKVASMIEDSLAKALPVAIGFLASLVGLGGLGERIKTILMTVQKPVNKVFDYLVAKAVTFGRGIMKGLANSRAGRAAAAVRDKAKAAYAQGKAYVKGKVDAAKAWAKGKLSPGDKAGPGGDAKGDDANRAARQVLGEAVRSAGAPDARSRIESSAAVAGAAFLHNAGEISVTGVPVLQRTRASVEETPVTPTSPEEHRTRGATPTDGSQAAAIQQRIQARMPELLRAFNANPNAHRVRLDALEGRFRAFMAGKRGRALTSGERTQAMGILTEARTVSRTGYYASFRDFAWRELKSDPGLAGLMQADPTAARWSSNDTKSAPVIRCVVTRADGSQVTEMRSIDFEHLTRLTDQPFKRHGEADGTKPNLSPMLADANRYYQEALRNIGHAHWFTNDAIESFVAEHQLYPDRSPARTELEFKAMG